MFHNKMYKFEVLKTAAKLRSAAASKNNNKHEVIGGK